MPKPDLEFGFLEAPFQSRHKHVQQFALNARSNVCVGYSRTRRRERKCGDDTTMPIDIQGPAEFESSVYLNYPAYSRLPHRVEAAELRLV